MKNPKRILGNILIFYYSYRFGFIKILGLVLKWKDTTIYDMLFSERNNRRGVCIGKWYFGYLKTKT